MVAWELGESGHGGVDERPGLCVLIGDEDVMRFGEGLQQGCLAG